MAFAATPSSYNNMNDEDTRRKIANNQSLQSNTGDSFGASSVSSSGAGIYHPVIQLADFSFFRRSNTNKNTTYSYKNNQRHQYEEIPCHDDGDDGMYKMNSSSNTNGKTKQMHISGSRIGVRHCRLPILISVITAVWMIWSFVIAPSNNNHKKVPYHYSPQPSSKVNENDHVPDNSGNSSVVNSTTNTSTRVKTDDTSNSTTNYTIRHHHEIIPSLLSIVDPVTNQYITPATNNPIYEYLIQHDVLFGTLTAEEHSGTTSSNGVEQVYYSIPIVQPPTLSVSKTGILDEKKDSDVIVTWTDGYDAFNNSIVQDEDLIVLHCGRLDKLKTMFNHYTGNNRAYYYTIQQQHPGLFLVEVATIAHVRATSRKQYYSKSAKNSTNNYSGYDNNSTADSTMKSWYIPRFPLLRQEVCQFSLYQKYRNDNNDTNENILNALSDTTTPVNGIDGDTTNSESTINIMYELLAQSELMDISSSMTKPSAIHVAYANDPTQMIINFVTGATGTPTVRYRSLSSSNEKFNESNNGQDDDDLRMDQLVTGTSDTYTADMMCTAPANVTEPGKFYPPGQLHTVVLVNLLPNTKYIYKIGLASDRDNVTWDDETYTFTSAIPPGGAILNSSNNSINGPTSTTNNINTPEPFTYVVYADQGCPDGGWSQGYALATEFAEREVDRSLDPRQPNHGKSRLPIRSIHHVGDISYAEGAAHHWDQWFRMIQAYTPYVPLMVGIGNHEYDHTSGGINKDPSGVTIDHGYMPEWGSFGDDSGGECAVVMSKRFIMPQQTTKTQSKTTTSPKQQPPLRHLVDATTTATSTTVNSSNDFLPSNGVFWYSHEFGSVHTTVISSEHDLSPGSPQYRWLEQDLKNVDRSLTPWLVVETHRPFYNAEDAPVHTQDTIGIRGSCENLLHDYLVDLVVAGHYHAYFRSCDNLYQSQCYDSASIESMSSMQNNSNNNAGMKKQRSYAMKGPMHITVGTAGASFDDYDLYENSWTAKYIKGVFGYGRITVMNSSALLFEFVQLGDDNRNSTTVTMNTTTRTDFPPDKVLDSVWIIRHRQT